MATTRIIIQPPAAPGAGGGDTTTTRRSRSSMRVTVPVGIVAVVLAVAGYFAREVLESVRELREDHARMGEHMRHMEAEIDRLRDRIDRSHPLATEER